MKVATIGFFDGVHKGHRFLINFVKDLARLKNARSAIVTFSNHPAEVLNADADLKLLTLPDEKLERLNGLCVDEVDVYEFDLALSQMSAYDFMKYVLKDQLDVSTLVVGYDHTFGARDAGHDYAEYGKELGIDVVKAPVYGCVCSSVIRTLLEKGCIERANEALGYQYGFGGVVITGKQLGRQIGFPTANLDVDRRKLLPKLGAYEVRVLADGEWRSGMMNVGRNSVEVHIIGFAGDLYGKYVWLDMIRMIREEMTFDDVEGLRRQLCEDLKELTYKN